MLKVLRKKGVSKKILWVVSGIIIISFGFGFGMTRYSGHEKENAPAGKVFDKTITMKEFQRYAMDTRTQAILTHGPEIEKLLSYMDMTGETWNRILLVKEADHRKIKVDDREVIALIASQPTFQKDGALDKDLYNKIVTSVFRQDPRDFEEGLRDGIKIMKILRPAATSIRLSDEEIRQEYERRNRKVQVSYVLIDPAKFRSGIVPSEKEIQTYYDAHQAELLVPDSINVQYVQIALPEKASSAQRDLAREKAKAFHIKISNGADFLAAAKENELDAKETGFFNMEQTSPVIQWPVELVDGLFSAKEGSIQPITTLPNGFLVTRLLAHEKSYAPTLVQVREKIEKTVIASTSAFLANKKARILQPKIKKNMTTGLSFADTAKNTGLTVKQTNFFAMGDYIPEIGISEDFENAAFHLTQENRISDVVQTSNGSVILSLDANQPADEKKFEEAKTSFTQTLRQEKSSQAIGALIEDIRKKSKLENFIKKENPRAIAGMAR